MYVLPQDQRIQRFLSFYWGRDCFALEKDAVYFLSLRGEITLLSPWDLYAFWVSWYKSLHLYTVLLATHLRALLEGRLQPSAFYIVKFLCSLVSLQWLHWRKLLKERQADLGNVFYVPALRDHLLHQNGQHSLSCLSEILGSYLYTTIVLVHPNNSYTKRSYWELLNTER